MKKIFLSISVAILFIQIAVAQSGVISGGVSDSISGEGVAFAHIVVLNEIDSTMVSMGIADERGNFRIDRLPYGNYFVQVSSLGFTTQTVSGINLSLQQRRVNLSVVINVDITMLDETVIVDNRPSIEFRPDRRIVHIDLGATGGGESVADFLQSLPEVRVDGNQVTLNTFTPTILVNGRPASVAMSDLTNLPASLISSVEVITNPSVRFNPEGLGGIINLRTRRAIDGISGMVQGSAGTNRIFNSIGTLNYRTGQWNLFANAFNRYFGLRPSGELNQEFASGQNIFQAFESHQKINRFSPRIGADFEPDSLNAFTLYWEFARRAGAVENIHTWAENGQSRGGIEQLIDLDSRENLIGFNYTRTFRNQSELRVDLSQMFRQEPSHISTSFEGADFLNYDYDVSFDMTKTVASVSYTTFLFETYQFEGGLFFDREQTVVNDVLSVNSLLEHDHLFGLNRLVNAGFFSVGRNFGNFGVMAGLRAEHVHQTIDSYGIVLNHSGSNYFSFFPNVGINYSINGLNLMLNYGRRVRRPSVMELTPHTIIFGEYPNQRFVGNPNLDPAYTNSFEFGGHLRGSGLSLSSSVSYMHTKNDIADVFFAIDSLTFSTRENIATSQRILLNVSMDYHARFFGVWRPILSFQWGQHLYDMPNAPRRSFSNYHINLNNNFHISRSFMIIFRATHLPKTYAYASIIEARTEFAFGLRKTLFENNLILQITATNFSGANPTTNFLGNGFESRQVESRDNRAIFFGALYRFGRPIRTRANVDLNLNRIEFQ